MTTELKPCLRCGGKMVVRQPQAFWHEVVCVECDFPYETPSYPKAQDAIDGYNTDYDESPAGQKDAELAALRAEVARLRAALEQVEWEYMDDDSEGNPIYSCLWCGNDRADGQPRNGHAANCQRRLALLNKDAE